MQGQIKLRAAWQEPHWPASLSALVGTQDLSVPHVHSVVSIPGTIGRLWDLEEVDLAEGRQARSLGEGAGCPCRGYGGSGPSSSSSSLPASSKASSVTFLQG